MLPNNFLDPQLVSNYHKEYLHLINKYKNIKRPSIFIKYYNINIDTSSHDEETKSTYDLYTHSEIRFDVYDLTPTYVLSPIVNATSNVPDMGGQMYESTLNLVTFTIERPRINDIIMFYDPVKSKEIYRVMNYRVPINALYADDDSVFFYEMDLEVAPFNDINRLKTSNMFVYDLSEEKYIPKLDYFNRIEKLNSYNNILNEIIKFYDRLRDVYSAHTQVPILTNQILYNFKKIYSKTHNRLFENILCPYGLLDIIPKQDDKDIVKMDLQSLNTNIYRLYDFKKEEFIDYEFFFNDYQIDKNYLDINYLLYLTLELYREAFDEFERS